ncbi:MAG: hypothetical protein A3F73_06570 [Gallionellales bacterium RIFCSPLOWO2_12_FULL_59_22]|nr:MAG: hypothetical protein A3H99_11455 [Gallionellales bacterium RIFCSPLOWO2_02_FULL_59_110]OGT13460.1 MAG: hypothetical protein A3F73_06570 [Gallionellales bacterium RIFCSPLOWO2_12_FULL_59_22]
MKKINFVVHIPKTAGTSFRSVLQKHKSVRMLYDYGKESPESTPGLVGVTPTELAPESEIFDADKFNFICGHVPYEKYLRCVPPDAVVSIVRNPVERVVSEYQHLRRHEGCHRSFADFSSDPLQQNKQWKMLRGLDRKTGALIGLTSHYKYFVEAFVDRLGLPIEPVAKNKAPDSDAESRANIPPGEIKSAFLNNKRDMDFFFEQVRIFSELVKDAGYNTVPTEDTNWNCLLAGRKKIVGWISCAATDCYFVTIGVNGERRAVISLDQNRDDIYDMGLSDNPLCGFSYPLALIGAEKGDRVTVGVFGAPEFARTLNIDWEQ